ncbi:MAG: hypothetical protein ACK4Q4_05355 [Rhodocyclaceae bacterium]
MTTPFVRKRVPETCHAPIEEWQPAFFDPLGKLCPMLPSAIHAERYLDFLEHRIARRPTDLLAHVRRILLARAHRRSDVVADALQDLFRVLGGKGAGLRAHLLELCEPLLDAETLAGLRESSSTTPRQAKTAIVTRLAGKRWVARPTASGKAAILTEALSCLENGQVEEACGLLESHLRTSPGDVGVTRILLDIYRRAHDYRAFAALRAQLEPLPESVRPLWEATAASLARSA